MSQSTLYRAQLRSKLQTGVTISRSNGRRLPSNVPFAVDNVWEYTRPDTMPSRRHSVYASPTPALALGGASQGSASRDDYVVCRLELVGTPRLLQIEVEDARQHRDVEAVQREILRRLRVDDWAQAPLERKLALAPLFLPGVTRAEMQQAVQHHALLAEVVHGAAAQVTLWTAPPAPNAHGEIFFELDAGQGYVLHPLD
ncbi:MAG TPA: hypothetical protein VN361_10195 [Oxalicibacterium sp.]|nr:hypothetical protein [Oxalicibacterium sp.]